MAQCQAECRGSNKKPAIILKEDRGNIMFACFLEDFVSWAQALAELGQGQAMRSRIRELRRKLDELEEMTK